MPPRWYAVQTRPRAEWGLHRDLRSRGYDTLYLHYEGTVRHARRVFGVQKAYFPRYIFAAVHPGQSIGPINEHRLTAEIVRTSQGPLIVPMPVIEELKGRGDDTGKVGDLTPEKRELIETAAEVRILSGSFAGFLATVKLDEGRQIKVWLSLFGRPTEASVRPSDVELVSPKGGLVSGNIYLPRR